MHRRNHAGINRIREMPHATADAPKNLTSAAGVVCVHSARPCARAAARIKSHERCAKICSESGEWGRVERSTATTSRSVELLTR